MVFGTFELRLELSPRAARSVHQDEELARLVSRMRGKNLGRASLPLFHEPRGRVGQTQRVVRHQSQSGLELREEFVVGIVSEPLKATRLPVHGRSPSTFRLLIFAPLRPRAVRCWT